MKAETAIQGDFDILRPMTSKVYRDVCSHFQLHLGSVGSVPCEA